MRDDITRSPPCPSSPELLRRQAALQQSVDVVGFRDHFGFTGGPPQVVGEVGESLRDVGGILGPCSRARRLARVVRQVVEPDRPPGRGVRAIRLLPGPVVAARASTRHIGVGPPTVQHGRCGRWVRRHRVVSAAAVCVTVASMVAMAFALVAHQRQLEKLSAQLAAYRADV